MGTIWSSTERGRVHNSSQLNEERGDRLTQEDTDSNCEEIFYETVGNVSSNDILVVQELETEIRCTKKSNESSETQTCIKLATAEEVCCQQEEKIPQADVHRITNTNVNNFNTEASRSSPSVSEKCEEDTLSTKINIEKWANSSHRARDPLLVKEEVECSTFSLPLISEEKVFSGKHVKSMSDPEMFASDIPPSCSWQVDVDCFKSKKRNRKPPKKYLKAKEHDLQADYNDANRRSASTDKRKLYTESCLASKEIATQEMMAGRKVLDLRRW